MYNLFSTLAASLFVITGGPSVGKTSIINELEKMGEVVCTEAATDVIASYQENGVRSPWELPNFESEIYLEKVKREGESQSSAKNSGKTSVFADRGLLDSLVYLEANNKLDTEEYILVTNHLASIDLKDYYKAVFYVEPHSGTEFIAETTELRHEDTKESIRLGLKVKQVYQEAGIPTIVVPPYMTPRERAEFVLEKMNLLQQS